MFNCRTSLAGARKLWAILIIVILIGLLLGGCKEEPKVYRVGVLSGLNYVAGITDGFKEAMTELGYVEGENISYDVQKTDFDMEAYQSILDQFIADEVDLILVFPTEATIMAKSATEGTDIPVLFTFALIEDMGIVDSVAAPGGNITGVRYPGTDVALRRFEVLLELAPDAKRIWAPYQRGYPIVEPQLKALRSVAEEAGVELIEFPADDGAEVEAGLKELVDEDGESLIDAILILIEPLGVNPDAVAAWGKFAYDHQLPIGGALAEADGYGTIFGVNVEIEGSGRDAAPLADKILTGIPAGTIPVYSAESYLEIDVAMAKKLGVEIPETILNQANIIVGVDD